jgi:hypothetical protein
VCVCNDNINVLSNNPNESQSKQPSPPKVATNGSGLVGSSAKILLPKKKIVE